MTALSFEAVTYSYPGPAEPVLRDVSLSIEPGEFVVLAGGTGSGKSTLLAAAAGLVPHFYGGSFAGRVVAGGLDTREHGPADISAVAGSLFQDPETQVIMGTVRGELAFPLENHGWSPAAMARGVEEAALALGIAGLLDRSTHELSGGELQRVALGAALAGRPPLVLLDEPTSQLDPVAGDELLGVLRRLNEEWGTAVVIAEHRLERCLAAADRVVALHGGRVACDAPPREFLEWAGAHAPDLQTPGARLFSLAGIAPPPVAVKDARATLRALGAAGTSSGSSSRYTGAELPLGAPREAASHDPRSRSSSLRVARLWFERREGATVLRDLSLEVAAGEVVALMGRNGAGKSTLLRCIAGLEGPTRGRIVTTGRVALLLQNPGDYFVRDRVGAELGADELDAAGLSALADRHPRDLSGGERQRLALAIVTGGDAGEHAAAGPDPAVLCLDEPTRGMDRERKRILAGELRVLAQAGTAIVLATHDTELAAEVATRTVLLGDGSVVADAPTREVLAGGWYFATQTARILGGAGGALTPEEGAELLTDEEHRPSQARAAQPAGRAEQPFNAAVDVAIPAAEPDPAAADVGAAQARGRA